MSFSLINNLGSLDSQAKLSGTSKTLNKTLQRLSSGLRINNSGDDAAGLAIANAYRSDISTLTQGVRNANDGASTLQIVDGGLQTISSLLDRATTLATQSASDTFTGNRDTLNSEFGKVLTEITRQAQSVGLGGAAGTDEGRYNKQLSVYIGGGATASSSTNQVNVDLSNSRVDSTGLNLNGLNIGTGTGNVTGAQSLASGITNAENIIFQTPGSSGALQSFRVNLSAGSSSSNVIDAINNDANVQAAGIKASLDSNDKLVLSSSQFFAVASDVNDAAGTTGIGGAGSTGGDYVITSAAHKVSKFVGGSFNVGGTESLEFSGDEIGFTSSAKSISFNTSQVGATASANAAAAVNGDNQLRDAGVFAIVDRADGSNISFVSLKDFNFGAQYDAGGVANSSLFSQSLTAAGAATLTGGAAGAKTALESIKAAIGGLGVVQGKVGAGQNNLSQAIDLASSQIANFQAAESAIRDADIASEASNLSRLTILQQAGVSALAQANQSSQSLLSLLR